MRIVDLGIAAVGGVAGQLLVHIPLGWRLALLRAGNVTMTQLIKTSAFRKLYLAQNKAYRRREKQAEAGADLTAVPGPSDESVALFFSGGADSTYSAVLLAQSYRRVHLLCFTHDGIANTHKPRINAERLMNRFGDRIVYHVVDGNDLWRRLYLSNFAADRKRYDGFLNTGACECCYLSWNAIAVVYCKRNDLSNLAVGIDRDHSGFMYSAGQEGIETMRRFHAGHGIRFFMPVYNEPATDVRLYEMGITVEKNTKRPYQFYTTSTTQGTCEFGLGHRLYAQHAVVRYQPEERLARARAYFDDKLEVCRHYVAETLEQDFPIPFLE